MWASLGLDGRFGKLLERLAKKEERKEGILIGTNFIEGRCVGGEGERKKVIRTEKNWQVLCELLNVHFPSDEKGGSWKKGEMRTG